VQSSWLSFHDDNAAKNISNKFKSLRSHLKAWSRNLSNLNLLIQNCNTVILFLESLKDRRTLFFTEANLRNIIKRQLKGLLPKISTGNKDTQSIELNMGMSAQITSMLEPQFPIREIVFLRS
jgi:hypothetical protein